MNRRLPAVAVDAILLAELFLAAMVLTWRKWPDVIVDFGHELYIPWRWSVGDLPYRDFDLATGPASQLYHAALFRLLGPSLTVLIVSNLAVLALISTLIWRWLLAVGTRWSAFAGVAVFLSMFAFGQQSLIGNYNYVCPYRHEVTHGLLAGLVVIAALRAGARSGKPAWHALAGCAAGFAVVMKPEVAAPACGVLAWGLLASAREHSFTTVALRGLWACGGFVASVGGTIAALATKLTWAEAFAGTFAGWSLALRPELTREAAFYRMLGGWDHLGLNAAEIALTLTAIVTALMLLLGVDRAFGGAQRSRAVLGVIGLAALVGAWFALPRTIWDTAATTLPFVALATAAWASWSILVRGRTDARTRELGAWSVFAFLLSLKMLFRMQFDHYGFVLAVPATMLAIHLLLVELPRFCVACEGSGLFMTAVCAGLIAACAAGNAWSTLRVDALKRMVVGLGGDRFYADGILDARPKAVRSAMQELGARAMPDHTLLVIPDGTMINYQLRMRNPTRHLLLGPWDLLAAGGEQAVLAELQAARPTWIIIADSDVAEHGVDPFGSSSYGERITAWIGEQYEPVQLFQNRVPGRQEPYSVQLLRLK